MKVLDLGSGLGSVAIQAAELVGPTGTVLGIELDPALVELSTRRARSAGKSNITFLRGDVDSPFLLELLKPHYGRFDAIIGRFLLRELKDAGESLRRVSRLLSKNGILAIQEKIPTRCALSVPPLLEVERARLWMDEARRRAGVEPAMGAQLVQLYSAAGLKAPKLRCDAPVGHGAKWAGFDYLAESLRAMLPLIRMYGIASEREIAVDTLADRMRADAIEQEGVVILTPCISAWAGRQVRRASSARRAPPAPRPDREPTPSLRAPRALPSQSTVPGRFRAARPRDAG
jgi:SAM-dependent methyltransferase